MMTDALCLTDLRAAAGEVDITDCGNVSYRGMPISECRIHDRLRARLLLFSGPTGEALWIVADTCSFRREAAAVILASVERVGGISADRVLLAGTHGHAVHNYTSFNAGAFSAAILSQLPELRSRLRGVATLALREAHTPSDAPVINRRIGFGALGEHCCMFNDDCRIDAITGRLDVAAQLAAEARRLGTSLAELGLPESGFWADGLVDDRLHLATLYDAENRAIASIARVNAHAVTASQSRVGAVVSADFIRPLEDAVRAKTADAPCLVFNGAFGNTRPLQREYSTDEAARIGRSWAAAMLAAPAQMEKAPALRGITGEDLLPLRDDLPHTRAGLLAVRAQLQAPLAALVAAPPSLPRAIERKRLEERLASIAMLLLPAPPEMSGILVAGDLERGAVPLRLQAWCLGSLRFLAMGGEPFVRLAADIEQRSGLLPLGVAGPYVSYLPDPASCAGGGYEVTEILYGPNTLARLSDIAAALAERLKP